MLKTTFSIWPATRQKILYPDNLQLIISELELMLAPAESKYLFKVSFLHIIYDQELFDSKVQSIFRNVQISDNEILCECPSKL